MKRGPNVFAKSVDPGQPAVSAGWPGLKSFAIGQFSALLIQFNWLLKKFLLWIKYEYISPCLAPWITLLQLVPFLSERVSYQATSEATSRVK